MSNLNPTLYWFCIAFLAAPLLHFCKPKQSPGDHINKNPNIIMLLADDLGYGDLRCYGSDARTPHLDQLASDGAIFTNFYAAAPNCSPSRVGLLTGRVPGRAGMYSYRPSGSVMHLPDKEMTMAELLRDNGYQTAHFGKWHLGCLPQDGTLKQPQPEDHGFEYSFGTENNAMPSHLNPENFIRNGQVLGKLPGYSCQLVAQEVRHWFDHHYTESKPFFLYVAFNEVHTKIASPEVLIAHYADQKPKIAEYLANVENLDSAVGIILQKIAQLGMVSNTFVFFSSDNGPLNIYPRSDGGLRGQKSWLYEGGIRVPGIIRWPGHVLPAQVDDTPAGFIDMLPTVAQICGIPLPAGITFDGISIHPLFSGNELNRNHPLFWFFYRTYPEAAIRMGDYVLLGKSDDTVKRTHFISTLDMDFIKRIKLVDFELYNIVNDPFQEVDISTKEPEVLEKMRTRMIEQLRSVTEEGPSWTDLAPYDPKKARYQKPL